MRPTLRVDVERFLERVGPSTATAVACGVHARRRDVEKVLAAVGFERVPPPDGRSPRGVYFGLSRLVPGRVRGVSRATVMLGILRDGVSIYVNNGAAELRAAGYDVRAVRQGGEVVYRIVSFPPDQEVAA